MTKLKTPLLSLRARGSIGDSITFQGKDQDTIVRKKPIPAYRYTLPQAYQRWLYQDYAYLWTLQSEATKREYAAGGTRHHLTGFQNWMKIMLYDLPRHNAYWKLDINTLATTPDTTPNANTMVVHGASPSTGLIGDAFYFDGLNDRLAAPDSPSLRAPEAIAAIFYAKALPANQCIISKYRYALNKREFHLSTFLNKINFVYTIDGTGATAAILASATNILIDTWYSILGTWDGTTMHLYINGSKDANTTLFAGPIFPSDSLCTIGRLYDIWHFKGIIDQVILYDSHIDDTLAKRITSRVYPS